jgi:hypothetical protein
MSCDELDFNKRCPVDENAKNAFEPGDVNKFFERVTTDEEFAKYNITIHSRPRRLDDDESVKDGPWLITFENFISNQEADRLIELGGIEGYKRSSDGENVSLCHCIAITSASNFVFVKWALLNLMDLTPVSSFKHTSRSKAVLS